MQHFFGSGLERPRPRHFGTALICPVGLRLCALPALVGLGDVGLGASLICPVGLRQDHARDQHGCDRSLGTSLISMVGLRLPSPLRVHGPCAGAFGTSLICTVGYDQCASVRPASMNGSLGACLICTVVLRPTAECCSVLDWRSLGASLISTVGLRRHVLGDQGRRIAVEAELP